MRLSKFIFKESTLKREDLQSRKLEDGLNFNHFVLTKIQLCHAF